MTHKQEEDEGRRNNPPEVDRVCLDPDQVEQALDGLSFSKSLPKDSLKQLATELRIVEFPRGSMVFREGELNTSLYVVVKGHFVLGMNIPGRGAVPILTVGRGDMFGWSSLLGDGKMTTNAVATEDATCLAAPASKLRELCEANHTFGYHLMERMGTAITRRLIATRLQLLDMFDHRTQN